MDFLTDILCKYPLLPWLIPFLLGLAVGWAIWGRYKSVVAELEGDISGLKTKIKGIENDLAGCRSHSAELEGDLALAKGKLRETEAKLSMGTDLSATTSKSNTAVAALSASVEPIGASTDKYVKLKSDNLQVIEGIGPKMDEVLKANGVGNWSELANQSSESLRAILDKYGDSYRIIDPSTWPEQAQLAVNGDYDGLIALQKNLDTGMTNASNTTDSKLEKIMIKLGILKAYKQDDLKVIEGIGPKIEKLLHDAGIKTWATLSETSTDRLKEILNAAGSNFQLADPSSWAKQAEMAASGQFKDLEDYQDFLNGGKEA
jgi:predicted flap endonuclease-1-like 5' DNA nuclease